MVEASLAQVVERKPQLASDIFWNVEGALNRLLPPSNLHKRYSEAGEVALAAVIARDTQQAIYSPLDPETPNLVSCLLTNRAMRPSAWQPKDTDAETLGGEVPEELGRFAAFALAKINWLTQTMGPVSSFDPDRENIPPGMVRIAGGIHVASSLAATSGLWEVHDHVATKVFTHEILRANQNEASARTADELAAVFEPIFDRIRSAQGKTPAEEVKLRQYGLLLVQADDTIMQAYSRQR